MLAGAVSFLYSIPCDSFQTLLQQDPTKAILAIKEIIMLTTDMRSTLMSRTVSEGRLNMFKAATTFQKRFNCSCHLAINKISHIGDDFVVDYFSGFGCISFFRLTLKIINFFCDLMLLRTNDALET